MYDTDRKARLLRVEHLLSQREEGMKVREIAELCGVCTKTTYRDLKALEKEVGIPFWEKDARWGIVKGHYLPPIRFSLPEAMTVFLAARLMSGFTKRYDPNIESTFFKLNSIVPSPLREQVQRTMDWMKKQRRDDRYLRILSELAEAWTKQNSVIIRYRSLGGKQATERKINPYFIEPALGGRASYVIGYCHRTNEQRTFKIERISSVVPTDEHYEIPSDFDANAYLSSAFGIIADGEVATVRLKFAPGVARIAEETTWHPSQVVERQADGSVLMTLNVMNTVELMSWILGWGEQVEVLEPEGLRKGVVETARAMLDVYR